MGFKNIRTGRIKSNYCVQLKSFCLQINSPCLTKAATKNESSAKTWYDFKKLKLKMQTATVSTRKQQLKPNHFALRYKMKSANKKKSRASSNRKG